MTRPPAAATTKPIAAPDTASSMCSFSAIIMGAGYPPRG